MEKLIIIYKVLGKEKLITVHQINSAWKRHLKWVTCALSNCNYRRMISLLDGHVYRYSWIKRLIKLLSSTTRLNCNLQNSFAKCKCKVELFENHFKITKEFHYSLAIANYIHCFCKLHIVFANYILFLQIVV